MATGDRVLALAEAHVGERYVFGAHAPKEDPNWRGPWDCAELASWAVYQASGRLYGCLDDTGPPADADAWTGSWKEDSLVIGRRVSIDQARGTPGAFLLRFPTKTGSGHIALSDGHGGTVEAHSPGRGVIRSVVEGRRWDAGVLVPWLAYASPDPGPAYNGPREPVLRLVSPRMSGPAVRQIQESLLRAGFDPHGVDGVFGPATEAAVVAFQKGHALVPDGEVGPDTRHALSAWRRFVGESSPRSTSS